MNTFEYAAPKTIDEAAGLLSGKWGETEVLAGGTDLVTALKQEITTPKLVVSLKNVEGLSGIEESGGALTIGAMATMAALASNSTVRKQFPALVTAVENISSAQILNAGTVGGDLLQRPRCWYYRQGFGLLGQHDGDSLIPDGDNRYHAIFGNDGLAQFVNPSSLAPGLIALGASVTLQGPKGARTITVADLFTTPKNASGREHTLASNEILTEISVPLKGLKNAAYEIRPRRGLDWSLVAAAVAFDGSSGKAKGAKVVLGHVAPVPWFSDAASKALDGQVVSEASAQAAGKAAADGATSLSKNGYKVQQVSVAVKRAILAAGA